MPDLLLELFSEEIPARMQARARDDLRRLVTDGLVEAGLTYASAGAFSTPRRLVLTLDGLSAQSRPQHEERKGPSIDAPRAALEGFLKAFGLNHPSATAHVDSLALPGLGGSIELNGVKFENRDVRGKQFYFAIWEKPGRPASEIVAEVVEQVIRSFPWPKSMRWGSGSLRWVRPLHSILCLLSDEGGAEVVPLEVDGIAAGNTTAGHRFMAPARFAVSSFDDYRARLRRAFVVLDPAEREAQIWHDAATTAFAQGLEVVPDAGLLAEVAGLVEWPVVLMGSIGADFLGLPPEVLQTSMKEHQKFFSVRNPGTGRIERFITVANRETADHGVTILAGNQKVLAARLSDARFFWENDLRVVQSVGLEGMAAGLANVTFHNELGSEAERVERIAALAHEIAPMVGASPDLAEKAAMVCKADLQSAMVGEFPELQGTMGSYYALEQGLDPAIARACKEHRSPLGPSDDVPTDPVSVAVALADKIDTLTGFWAIDEKPTGSKDPFALRRAALGVIRLVVFNGVRITLQNGFIIGGRRTMASMLSLAAGDIERGLKIKLLTMLGADLSKLPVVEAAELSKDAAALLAKGFGQGVPPQKWELERSESLLAFLHDRLKVWLRDQGIRHDVIDSCLAMPGNDDLTLLVKLLAGFKRANNILTQAEEKDGVEYSYGADLKFAESDSERALFTALDQAEATITPALQSEDFATAMAAMAALRAPIDAFFTDVQVNSDNPVLRRNRLNLLHRIRSVCGQVADLATIEG
ncbi:MAG: glycine--tRNA ligase subunit beta [Rhodobacter sp.]|nr:glycine--tRNA ligase subunit beta [Rhodobacter sp.]